jgi:sarcosine oxidase
VAITARFVVVGCGLLGLATAAEIGRRGHEVIALDLAEPGHEWSGSKGSARIFRLAYDDPRYVSMARESLPLWRALEAQADVQILRTTGLLSFGSGLDELASAMRAGGGQPELLGEAEVRSRYPELRIPGPAILDPAAGVLAADKALAALTQVAKRHAVTLQTPVQVRALVPHERGVTVRTSSGVFEAEVVVVCAGPGSGTLVGCPTLATLEQVAWFAVPPAELPCVARRDEADGTVEVLGVYGLPDGPGLYKFGLHHAGPEVTLGRGDLGPDEQMLASLRHACEGLIDGLDPVAAKVERCVYDNTADGHFILDRVGRVVVGAGTSGHGFKFGPLLGRILADLACDLDPGFDLGFFSLSRLAASRRAAIGTPEGTSGI